MISEILRSFGYQPLEPKEEAWAKPVGYSLFTFSLTRMEWMHHFHAANDGSPQIMSSRLWDGEGDFLLWLTDQEAFTHRVSCGRPYTLEDLKCS